MKSLRGFRYRLHRCYGLAWKAMAREPGADGFLLIHGTIAGMLGPCGHAWIGIVRDCIVYDPVLDSYFAEENYIADQGARVERMYTQAEAMEVLAKASHYGPWHHSPQVVHLPSWVLEWERATRKQHVAPKSLT